MSFIFPYKFVWFQKGIGATCYISTKTTYFQENMEAKMHGRVGVLKTKAGFSDRGTIATSIMLDHGRGYF